MNKVALIACCKKKLPGGGLTEYLYQGQLFKAQLAYARTLFAEGDIYVVSAKYELVALGESLTYYEWSLKDMDKREREVWAEQVVRWLYNFYMFPLYVSLMAGGLYWDTLKPVFGRYGITFEVPHPPGLGYAQQVVWYTRQLAK